MKIIHHNDADGYMSARIVLSTFKVEDDDLICMDYTKELDLSLIEKDERVYIVDYSLEPEKMKSLLEITKDVIWIDHHKSAIEKYNDYPELKYLKGIRFDGISATGLSWLYMRGALSTTGNYVKDYYLMMKKLENAPLGVQLINDWDVWNHFIPETKPFMIALNSHQFCWKSPKQALWGQLMNTENDNVTKILYEAGKSMIDYRDGWSMKLRERYGFVIELEGYKVYCLNLGNANSEFFGELIDEYDAVMTFCFNGELFNASIYSDGNVDVSEIAKKFGGGGHKGASGFTFDDFDFIKSRLVEGENNG